MAKDAAYWLTEIAAAKKREKDFCKDGKRIIEIYDGTKAATTPFNILLSNTETLLPALYSAIPRPVVSRRFKDEDLIAKSAAEAGERCLSFLIDTNTEGYETFDEAMRAATLDALLPGRGVTSLKYDAELEDLPLAEGEKVPSQYKKAELACCDTRTWSRVFFGYAKKWSKVPWMAYEEHIDRAEAERLFGDLAAKLVYTETDEDDKEKKTEDQGERRTACIYQIWDKDGGRKVRYVASQFRDGFLKVENDPLGLTGFFNCPKPLQFIEKTHDLLPVAPYILYENQAKELNEITRRISRITKAIKAKALYDGELGDDIKNIVEADDNAFVPAQMASTIAYEKGLQNALWFWPVDKLIVVLQQLMVARESCKATIFEIMGLADVMRGASQASETLGAQEIKQAWGGLRLKRSQKEVQRYARDILRLMLEIAATKFSEETWARMTGLPFLTEPQVMEQQQILQAAQMQMQQMQAMMPPPQPPQPGQPPQQPPQPPPQMQQAQQAMQAAQAELQKPQWSQVLQILRDDMQRAYRIDIETNSTVEPEAVEDQKNIADVMNALGQYLNGITPLVEKGVFPFQGAQAMMLAIVRRFRFGDEIEDYIKQMKQPAPQDDGKAAAEAAKSKMEQEKHQADMQAKQMEFEQKKAAATAENAMEQQRAQIEREKMQMQAQYDAAEHAYKMEELAAKRQLAGFIATSKIRVAEATAAAKEKSAKEPANSNV